MDRLEVDSQVRSIIAEYSYLGEITDVWVSPNVMDILDPRPPLERISKPFKLGPIWVSATSELLDDEVKVAFKTYFLSQRRVGSNESFSSN